MRHFVFLPAALAALALVPVAVAVGPSLPALVGGDGIAATAGDISYVTHLKGTSTRVVERSHGKVIRQGTVAGAWGVQLATITGAVTGLSPNGRVLALSDDLQPDGSLRTRSRVAIVDTGTLALQKTISLRGDYSIDALSPNGALLYLIHHVSTTDVRKYQVVAYDLKAERLLPGVIADKSQAGWVMAGLPVSRAARPDGSWVYTLYQQDGNYPFVHALDTVHHRAVCIGLPANWTTANKWISTARLALVGSRLEIRTGSGTARFFLDTRSFRVSIP